MRGNDRFNLIDRCIQVLFEPVEAHFRKRELDLVNKHRQQGGSSDGFKFSGHTFSHLEGRSRAIGTYDRPSRELVPAIELLEDERNTVEYDKVRIRQALSLSLKDCQGWRDIRDALPNSLCDLLPETKVLRRDREEAYTLADNPRAYNQYMALREKIDYYVASRLIY